MASVKRFPGCKVWYACYPQFSGRFDDRGRPVFVRVQQTTKLTDEAKALQLALIYEDQNKKAGARLWHQMQAKAFSQQVTALLGGADLSPLTARKAIDEWIQLEEASAANKKKTKKNYRGIATQFVEFLTKAKLIDRPVHELTRTHTSRRSLPRSRNTIGWRA